MSQRKKIIYCVQKLLDSDINAKTISDETKINIHVVRKLKSKEQSIESTNFDYVGRLFDFYIEQQSVIEAQKDVDYKILSEKLPRNVINFIDDMMLSINRLNTRSEARVSDVFVYDKYKLDSKGNSESKESYIEISETIAINRGNDVQSKSINIMKKINTKDRINEIKDLRLIFNREALIVELKKLKYTGHKIKLFKYDDGSQGIKSTFTTGNNEIYGIENDFLDINYKEVK
jgi:hypothetical protein